MCPPIHLRAVNDLIKFLNPMHAIEGTGKNTNINARKLQNINSAQVESNGKNAIN